MISFKEFCLEDEKLGILLSRKIHKNNKKLKEEYNFYIRNYKLDHHWAMVIFTLLSKIGYKIEILQTKLFNIAHKSL